MACINKSNPEYKKLVDIYGDTVAESLVRVSTPLKAEEFVIPTLKEADLIMKSAADKTQTNVLEQLDSGIANTETVVKLLKGVVHKYDGGYYVTRGNINSSGIYSSIIKKGILDRNLQILNNILKRYPKAFTIEQKKNSYSVTFDDKAIQEYSSLNVRDEVAREQYNKVFEDEQFLTEEEIAENKELLASEPFIGIRKNLPPGDFGQLKLFGEANVVDNKDTAIKQKYFPNSNINTSTDILQKIALSDHPLAMVAAQFLQFDPKVSIELVEDENIGSFVDDLGISRISAATYSNNKIAIAKDANFKGLGSEPTLLHEILHAMTNKYISKNPNSSEVKALKKVYEHALTLKTKMPRNVYSFTNLDEFIVAVFTDASTIKFLLEQPSISKSEPNFFFDIFKAIINLFKLDTSNTTLYNDAFIAATNIVIAQDAANKRNAEETFFIADDGTLFNIAAQGPIKPGVEQLFESNPELANQVYEALGFKTTITQDNKSYYRGQIEKPTIDKDGNLVLYAREDELYKRAGLKSKGISMTDDLQSAIEYGNGQLQVAQNLASESYDANQELERLSENGYYLIQIPKNVSNEIVKEAGEVKVIGDKIIIPKGQYKIEQVVDGVEQITPQQKQQALQVYSQYLNTIFPDSKVKDIVYHGANEPIEGDRFTVRPGATGNGIWFSGSKRYATNVMNRASESESLMGRKLRGEATMYSTLLNIKNPAHFYDSSGAILAQSPERFIEGKIEPHRLHGNKQYDKDINDGVLFHHPNSKKPETSDSAEQVVVFEPEQIHILGNKQDIEGFKKYVENKPSQALQLPSTYQTTATPETIAALKNLLERLGIPVETSETILEQFGANGLADGIRQVIQIANGKEDVALTEETMHMLTMMVPEAVLNELLDQITDYKMYANVYEQYKEHPAYQNPDGSPNVQMIKLEAAGKILAEYFIMNAEGLSKEEVNIAKTLWAKIKDWIKNVFGVNKDAFQDFINKIDSTEYRLFGMNSRAQNLLNIAFGKEEIAGFADTLSSGLAANSYAKAKEDFKHNIKSKDPLVQQLMNLEDLILNIKELDLPFVQKMKEYVHLPNKRAFATGKYKLEKATEEIDETQDFLEQLKERTTQALEYFRNTYATTSSLLDRVTVIQNMLRDDVDLLSPEEVKPKLTDLQRVRLYHELSIAKDIANNYKQQMQDLEALFKDLKPGVNDYGINDLIDKTKSLASKIESIEGVYSIENLEKTIEKFVAPQIEGYKKQKNKEVLRIQEQLNTLNNEIAKKGTSKSRLASKKRLEDLLAKTEHDLEYPPISAKAIIDILENNSNKKNNFFGITPIDMLMEAGRTNKNQAILAVSTILSDALLESQRAAEADMLDIKNLFDKYNRKQNLTGTAYDDITDQVVRYRFDEQSGELKERNENVLVNEVKQWQFENDLEVLRYLEYQATVNSGDNEFLEKQYAKYLGQELTPEEKTDLAGTFKKKYNDLMNIYGKRKYIDQYYEIQSILDNAVLSDGRTVREYRQQYIDAIKIADEELNNVLNTGIGEDVALSSKQEALRELQKLESLFDYNTGLKKKGDALVVAETILKWKKAKKNVEVAPGVFADIDKYYSTYYSEFRWKEEKDEYEKAIEDAKKVYEESPSAINQEALRIAEASYERWRKRNVIKRPPPEYYKEKARIIQAIQTILDGVKQYANAEQQYKLEVDEAWDIIRSATAGNRDEDGVIEGGKSQNIAEEVKKAEETLSELKTIIKQFRSRFTEEELFQLDKLNRQLDEMQETTTTSYWDDLLQAKVDIKKKQMVANGIEDPSFDQIMSELIEEDFFQKNMIDVHSKYRSTDTEDLPQDVIRFTSMINGKKIVKIFRPTYIWRDVLTKGKYEKQDKMAYSLMRYDVDERFINPNYETMYGTVSLDPSKVTADPIAKNRYFDEKFANLNSTQRDFLDQYREMYYNDQLFSPVNQRLGDTLPRITMAGVQRTAKIFNPLTMPSRLYKFFSKGLETSEMEAEYGEGALDENGLPVNRLPANAVAEFLKRKFSKQKPDTTEGRKGTKRINVKIFAKYVNKDMNISIPEKDLFRLLTMYNIERHRVESLKNYTPALNKALELSADKKIFKSLYTQVQFFLNKRTKAKEFGKLSKYVLDPVSDFARRSKGFLLLGTFLRLGSIFKNTIAGQYAIWVNKSRLKQYSQESYITATMKAVKGSALMVLQRFSSTPSKYVAMVRRLNVAVNFDINDATSNNREILLKTANGLGYGLGALRDGSEKQLELTMFELYRAANKIMIDGMAYDVEDCYEYKNGILTPKMIPSKNEDGSIKLDAEGNPVMVPMITPEQENDFTKNVMEMVSYTQGNFASDNMSMAKLYFLGRTLLFMKNFIYNPLMVRVGEKRVTATGHEIEGYYRILGSMIGTAFNNPENFEDFLRKAKDIKGVPGRFATVMKTRSPQEKNALNLFFKDFAMVSGIGAVLYFLEKGLKEGDTDDDSQLWWYMAFLKKVFAEISFYNIVDIVGTLIKIMVSDKEEVENARSNDPIDKAAWYFVGNPSINLAFSAFFPLQHNTFNLSPENVTDPFYSQYKDNVLLYNFMVQLGTKPDLFYGKRALSSYEHFNKSLTDYETESEKKRGKSRSGGRSGGRSKGRGRRR